MVDYGGIAGCGNMMNYSMMGNNFVYGAFYYFLVLMLLIGLVILVYLWIFKLWRNIEKKKR